MGASLESRLVRHWLEKKGLSASELARRLEVTPSAVLQWKSGATSPKNIAAVASALKLTVPGFYGAAKELDDEPTSATA